MSKRGTLVLVVGPSGAGKDSLIAGARDLMAGHSQVRFARRTITHRQNDKPSDEDHVSLSVEEFENLKSANGFILSWQAHGLRYGIPMSYEIALRTGCSVIANVSRSIINQTRQRLQPMAVIQVTADPDVLAERLAKRGREVIDDQEARLRRALSYNVRGSDVFTIENNGTFEQASAEFNDHLRTILQINFEPTRAAAG